GRRLGSRPKLDRAARRGELSFAQTSMIADASEADPEAEGPLLQDASRLSVSELKDRCAKTKADAHPDLEARRKEIHKRRYLRSWTDVEGMWHLSAGANPEDGAKVMAALSPITEEIFATARKEGRHEHPSAYALDSLVRLSEEAAGAGSRGAHRHSPDASRPGRRTPVKLLVRIDYDTWLRGFPAQGETCELVGYGPVAASAVRDLVDTGDPFVAAILTRARRLVGVAHLGRKPTSHQESALQWLYPSCAVEGCAAQARLERDHRIEWSKTHFTAFELLDLLCSHHHGLKTREGWELVEGSGKRRFVAPGDCDHPRNKKKSRAPSTGPP
ncbi:MAG: DUF222 domain-containing protein, partial [Acidimicrobiales bacterium]